MQDFTIYPIKVGEFTAAEKSNFTYQTDCGIKIVAPVIMYLIEGNGALVLVDTGCSDEDWAMKHHHRLTRSGEMHPLAGLKALGFDVEDVEIVINTHLHWDHCFNNGLFPRAKIYTQKREVEYALDPLPVHWVYYESSQTGLVPPWLKSHEQMVLVDGDHVLCPGIELVALPGHSPGFQGVLVHTAKGRTLIAGDCCPLFENWAGNGIHAHIPSGIHYRLDEYYASFSKMERICDAILPGHDPAVCDCRVEAADNAIPEGKP